MGMMSNQYRLDHAGHRFEVESSGDFDGKTQYSLILDNKRVDQTEATYGACSLRGDIDGKPVIVRIKTGIFKDKCQLDFDGEVVVIPKTG